MILLAYGNLRGIREAGRTFAVPTYFFIANMVLLIASGLYKEATGTLHAHPISGHPGSVPVGIGGKRASLRGRPSSCCCRPSPRAARP